MIDVRDLCVRVPGFALDRVTFMVPTGTVAVLTGPTGSGKTTVLETIAGVRPHESGTIRLGDRDVTRDPPEARRVGLVYQTAMLFPHLSVRDNISYGARDARLVPKLIEEFALAELLEKPTATLSGGERQQVAIARALACEPKTLLLDEPFAAMDSSLRVTWRSAVLAWAKSRGVTTLLVTHDAEEAALAGAIGLRITSGVVTSRRELIG